MDTVLFITPYNSCRIANIPQFTENMSFISQFTLYLGQVCCFLFLGCSAIYYLLHPIWSYFYLPYIQIIVQQLFHTFNPLWMVGITLFDNYTDTYLTQAYFYVQNAILQPRTQCKIIGQLVDHRRIRHTGMNNTIV